MSAEELGAALDALNEALGRAEEGIEREGLMVEVSVSITPLVGAGSDREQSVGWARHRGEWRLVLETRRAKVEAGEWQVEALANASCESRLLGAQHLPRLVEALRGARVVRLARVRAATAELLGYLDREGL